jgi:hypothetical protein
MPKRPHKKAKSLVPKSRTATIAGIVPHSRYGDAIVPSGCTASAEEVRGSFWSYSSETIFPESAIQADTTRQNFTVFPRGYYVDMLRQCRTCRRPFIFFAREQQHWYEELGFYIDADCVHCPECRRSDQQLRRRFQRYSKSIGRKDIDDRDLATLVGDAVFLWQAGVLREEQRLRRLRNLARQRIPGSTATASIDRVIDELKSGGTT